MKKILIATDGSACSAAAIDFGVEPTSEHAHCHVSLARALLSSVSRRMLSKSKHPVVVVRGLGVVLVRAG